MKEKKNVFLLGLTSFFNDFSSETIFALLPLYIPSAGAIGFIGGIMSGLGDLTKVYFGYLSDHIGRRKPIVFLGYFLSALSKLLISLISWPFFVIFLLTDRLGKGIREGPRDAILSLSEKRGWAFGIQKALDTSGAIAGSLMAYLIVNLSLDFQGGMFFAAIIGFFALIPLLFVDSPHFRKSHKNFSETIRGISNKVKKIFPTAIIFGVAAISPMIIIQESYKQVGKLGILAYIGFNLVYAFSARLFGSKSDKVGRKPVLNFSFIISGLSFLLIYLGGILSIIGFLLYGVAVGAFNSTIRAFIGDLAENNKGTSMGEFQTIFGLSVFFGSTIIGVLRTIIGTQAYLIPASLSILAYFVFTKTY